MPRALAAAYTSRGSVYDSRPSSWNGRAGRPGSSCGRQSRSHCTARRADLHVHSSCSDDPTNPGIRALHGRESYTDPLEVYAAAKARGMDYVTITDHNTLDGSLA